MGTVSRQALKTHRPFKAVILDKEGTPVLWVSHRFNQTLSSCEMMAQSCLIPHHRSGDLSSSSIVASTSRRGKAQTRPWSGRLSSQCQLCSFCSSETDPYYPLTLLLDRDWHLWRRKYNLFLSRPKHDPETGEAKPAFDQFAAVDEGLLAWEFWLRDSEGRARGSVSRNFGGFGREIFTDTGQSRPTSPQRRVASN